MSVERDCKIEFLKKKHAMHMANFFLSRFTVIMPKDFNA